MERKEKGATGELLALIHLRRIGYELLYKNIRFGRVEVDLIMLDKDSVVFVEVKARKCNSFGLPREAVDLKKQKRLVRAALSYMQKLGSEVNIRFDVVEVDLNIGAVNHIINAFTADSMLITKV